MRYSSASRGLKIPTGWTSGRRSSGTAAAFAAVTSTRPAGPDGHSPATAAGSRRLSSTTSHGRPVSRSQPANAAAAASPTAPAAVPVAAAASAYPASTAARLLASAHTSSSTRWERHSSREIPAACCPIGSIAPASSEETCPGIGR